MNEELTKKPVLIEEDWNFSKERMPDDELVPCLLWEFIRESKTAQQLAQDWTRLGTTGETEPDQNKLNERMRALKFNLKSARFQLTFGFVSCFLTIGRKPETKPVVWSPNHRFKG